MFLWLPASGMPELGEIMSGEAVVQVRGPEAERDEADGVDTRWAALVTSVRREKAREACRP